ncbi:MAG: hypothetical protein ACLGI3_16845 [Actinomycetes bacterium]
MIGTKENVTAAVLAVPMELAKISTDLQRGLAEFANGQRVTAGRAVGVARRLAWGGSGRLTGWSLLNGGTGTVQLTFHDGRGPEGDLLGVVVLAPGEDVTAATPGPGLHFGEALWLQVTLSGGAVDVDLIGAVWLGAVD